jgi:glycosyltransferase involved in cell wall biosynthesis
VDAFELSASYTTPSASDGVGGSLEQHLPPEFEVLLEEYSGPQTRLRAGMILSAERLSLNSEGASEKAYLEYLHVSPPQTVLRDPDQLLNGRLGQVNARVNISALRPGPGDVARLFSLKVLAKDEAQTAVSNEVRFTLQPQLAKIGTLGGFLSHPDAALYSRVLFLEGWALRPDDDVLSAEIFANDCSLGYANCNLPSPKQSASLPDFIEASRSRFAFCLDYDRRGDTSLSTEDWQKSLHISALIEFKSGHKERIEGVSTRWMPQPEGTETDGLLIGGLDSIGYAANGMLQIDGFLVHDSIIEPLIEVRWRGAQLQVTEESGTLSWENSVEIPRRYPSLANGLPRFCIQITPEAFGRLPGRVEVVVRKANGSNVVSLGPRGILASIPELLELTRDDSSTATRLAQTLIEKTPGKKRAKNYRPSLPECDEESRAGLSAKILFATHNLSACEGAPRVLMQVIADMHEQGRECLVVSPEKGDLERDLADLDIPLFIIPEFATLGQDWQRYHRGLSSLQDIVSSYKPTLVYANVLDSFWGIDIAERNSIRNIWAIHESVYPETCFQEMEFSLRTRFLNLLPKVDKAVFVTNSTAALFSELIPREKREVIPNAIHVGELDKKRASMKREEVRNRLGISDEEHVISIVGTTTKRKGQDIFIREMALLRERHPELPLRLYVVGARDIPFLQELRDRARELRLDEVLSFVYETPDVEQYFIASDVIVIASREESAPLVSLEAFALERPLVSTTAFGLAEQIDHEVNALSYSIGNTGALADAVHRIISDPQLRARLIAGGRDTLISRFSYQKTREQYRSLFSEE